MLNKRVKLVNKLLMMLVLNLVCAAIAHGHGRYILPTHTVLSSSADETVSLLSSISNDVFHADRPLGDNGKGVVPEDFGPMFRVLKSELITPQGVIVEGPSWQSFARFSAADALIDNNGTSRIVLIQPETRMTTFINSEGRPARVFGTSDTPKGATKIVRRMVSSRVEVFITKNSPTDEAIRPKGTGLQLGGQSHPNDLYAGETLDFSLTFNGAPLVRPAEVSFVQEGTRHRNQRNEKKVKTDAQGAFSVTFSEPGFYLLESEVSVEGNEEDAVDVFHYSLYVTLEVFPQ